MPSFSAFPTWLIFVAALLGLVWGLAGLVVQAVGYHALASELPAVARAHALRLRANTVLLTLIALVAALLLASYWP